MGRRDDWRLRLNPRAHGAGAATHGRSRAAPVAAGTVRARVGGGEDRRGDHRSFAKVGDLLCWPGRLGGTAYAGGCAACTARAWRDRGRDDAAAERARSSRARERDVAVNTGGREGQEG